MPTTRPRRPKDAAVAVLVVAAVALGASTFVPVVAAAGICAFVPCDPGPKDAAVGYAVDGGAVLTVSPCASENYSRIRILTTDERSLVLWDARRVAGGKVQVVSIDSPPRQLAVTQSLAAPLPEEVAIEVTYSRGVARSWSYFNGVRRGRFGVFREGGRSLGAFNAQARAGAVCAWYRPTAVKLWPLIAVTISALLGLATLLRRRRVTRKFDADVRAAFADLLG